MPQQQFGQTTSDTTGGTPIGAYIQAIDAPVNFTQNGQEFLRAGSIKAYDASYANAITAAPQLRVFGSDAKTYGSASSSWKWRYYYTGTVYQAVAIGGVLVQQGAALSSLSTSNNLPGITASVNRFAVGGTYLVVPRIANTAPMYSLSGGAWTSVGGTFTTFPQPTAICFGNNSWLALSSLNSVAGEQGYINAANPSGVWTVGSSGAAITASAVNAISYGAGVFVAVTADSTSATSKKIATCPSVGGAWTDRTPSNIAFAAAETITDCVFNGTAHVAVTSTGRVISSTDGTNWTQRATPFDLSSTAPFANTAFDPAVYVPDLVLATDGAGTVTCHSLASTNTQSRRAVVAVSTDNGATWSAFQPYIGKAAFPSGNTPVRSMSYANGRWIENHSGDYQSLVDIGTSLAAAPDYVGQQSSNLGIGQYVRIK